MKLTTRFNVADELDGSVSARAESFIRLLRSGYARSNCINARRVFPVFMVLNDIQSAVLFRGVVGEIINVAYSKVHEALSEKFQTRSAPYRKPT